MVKAAATQAHRTMWHMSARLNRSRDCVEDEILEGENALARNQLRAALLQNFGDRIVDTLEPHKFQFGDGSIPRLKPAAAAATTFSLMPPTGNTRPRSDISPVIAVSLLTVRLVSREADALNTPPP